MRTTTTNWALIVVATATCLCACQAPSQPSPPPPTTVTVVSQGTSDTPAPPPTPSTPQAAPVTTGSSSDEQCSTDAAAAIAAGTAQIARPLPTTRPDVNWVFVGNTNYNTCRDLSYAELLTEGATVSSPTQLLLFHRGTFLGTGIKCNVGYQKITGTTDSSVDVTYSYPLGNDANASPSGHASVVFQWNGSKVVMRGQLPYELTLGHC